MKYLFVDTETSGFYDNRQPMTSPKQGRLVQLAFITHDGHEVTEEYCALVRPIGFTIPPAATAVHGFTTERALREGIAVCDALDALQEAAKDASLLVAHNHAFDYSILLGEYARLDIMLPNITRVIPFCTMQALTPVCKLMVKNGLGFKWPRLNEAYRWCFERDMEGAHNALADARACMEIYWECRARGIFPRIMEAA